MTFDIEFDLNVAPAMTFIGYYFYGFRTKEFKTTLGMRNLHAKLNPESAAEQ